MYIVVVGTSYYYSAHILGGLCLLSRVYLFEMWKGLENGLPVGVVFGFKARPLVFY